MLIDERTMFNAADPWDAGCERERHAFGLFMVKRFKKAAGRPGSLSDTDAAHAVIVGGLMAVLVTARAVNDGDAFSAEQQRAWHAILDFGFAFVEGIVPAGGESVQ